MASKEEHETVKNKYRGLQQKEALDKAARPLFRLLPGCYSA